MPNNSFLRRLMGGALFCATLMATANADPTIPAEDFARLNTLSSVRPSPDGSKFTARVASNNRYNLMVIDVNDGDLKSLFTAAEDEKVSVNRIRWARNDRLVMSLIFAGKTQGVDIYRTRLFGLNPDGSDFDPLFNEPKDGVGVNIQDSIISMLRNDPENILVRYYEPGENEPGVYRVNVDQTSNRHPPVQRPKNNIQYWATDRDDEIRYGFGIRNDKTPVLRFKLKGGDWVDRSNRVALDAPDFSFEDFAEDLNKAYVVSNHERDPGALYLYDIANDSFEKKLFEHPTNDIWGVDTDKDTGKLLGVGFSQDSDENNYEWLEDTPVRDNIDIVKSALAGYDVALIRMSDNQRTMVLHISTGVKPGQYILFDTQTKSVIGLPPQNTALENAALGEQFAVQYEARDGLSIPAYVTLPPGISSMAEAKNLPFVLMPHGGPSARDFAGYDSWAQFVATRGYGVLQMNFRGSTGYGQAFRDAGDKQWGQAMQDDIADGANWLIQQGYADKDKLAIMGGSYGGYAALMGAVKTPDLYQCAVSFAGVTDLPDFLREAKQFVNGKFATRHIGNLWKDGSMLSTNSPARRASDINIPVLLIHGEEDRVVDVNHSKKMRRALNGAKKDVTYIELPDGDHYLSLHPNRLTFFKQTEAFLKTKCFN